MGNVHQSLAANLSREHSYEPLAVEGRVPPELNGTFWQNGPGMQTLGGRATSHLFEGDGAVSAVRFRAGRAEGAVRMVATPAFAAERRLGRRLYGFNAPFSRRLVNSITGARKNTANTNVLLWRSRVFALLPGCPPVEVAAGDLTTLGETSFGGLIGGFSAHPHRVPRRKTTYNFAMRLGHCDLFAFPDDADPYFLTRVAAPERRIVHDFAVTENHAVLVSPPFELDLEVAKYQHRPFVEMFRWSPSLGTRVTVVPLDRPEESVDFCAAPTAIWHFANAHEAGGAIVVDAFTYDDLDHFRAMSASSRMELADPSKLSTLRRGVIDLASRRLTWETIVEGDALEFPTMHPLFYGVRYRYAYAVRHPLLPAALAPPSVQRIDVTSGRRWGYEFTEVQVPSEPLFVPGGGPDEAAGYVLVTVYDQPRHASFVAIFEACSLGAGPVGKVWFDHHIPHRFHGQWQPNEAGSG
jgi:all-trans-8'-apo-beta-carotenal 15,15'-oxygenase